jgi:uncharacterized protein (TIGR02001 family)
VVSDYDFRGYSQSAARPALQVSGDFSHKGFHADVWASTVQWGPLYTGSNEIDLQADYTIGSDEAVKATFGVIRYMLPSLKATPGSPKVQSDSNEAFVTIAKHWFSASAHYSEKWLGLKDSLGRDAKAWYVEANGAFPINDSGYTVQIHGGYSFDRAWKIAGSTREYNDFSAGVTKGFSHYTVGLKYVTSGAFPELSTKQSLATYGKRHVFETRDRFILSVSTTFPWS